MPRFRSLSTNTPSSPTSSNANTNPIAIPSSPTFLSRGIRSLRLHRRQSNSVPSSPARAESHLQVPLSAQYNSNPLSRTHSSDSSVSPTGERADGTENDGAKHIRLVPNVGISSRCFVFDIVERDLPPGVVLKIGRYSDRNAAPDRLSFKSKVVSRSHAEMWLEQDTGKIYIRDVGSSSGTFVNRSRLSPAGVCSSPQEIKDGDIIQLGVDYQGGVEPMYRAVRMRLEVNRETSISQPFSKAAFQQLRQHLLATTARRSHHQKEEPQSTDAIEKPDYPNAVLSRKPSIEFGDDDERAKRSLDDTVRSSPAVNQSDIQECCICLYAIAPFQALFIAPCSHIFHFKCLRPILFQNYPGFSCPLCRAYSDLEASVAMEVTDVLETLAKLEEHEDSHGQPAIPEEQKLELDSNPNDRDKRHSGLGRGLTIHNSTKSAAASSGAPELSTTLVEHGSTFEQILSASSSTSQ